jgi:hypothetical protein
MVRHSPPCREYVKRGLHASAAHSAWSQHDVLEVSLMAGIRNSINHYSSGRYIRSPGSPPLRLLLAQLDCYLERAQQAGKLDLFRSSHREAMSEHVANGQHSEFERTVGLAALTRTSPEHPADRYDSVWAARSSPKPHRSPRSDPAAPIPCPSLIS